MWSDDELKQLQARGGDGWLRATGTGLGGRAASPSYGKPPELIATPTIGTPSSMAV